MAEGDQKMEKFVIRCLNCHQQNRNHETFLYVDWKKKYYMVTCYTCNATEAFDQNSKKIKIDDTKPDGDKDKGGGFGNRTAVN